MKVGYMQYDVVHDKKQNIDYVKQKLKDNRYDIVVLPELSMNGYLFKSHGELLSSAESIPSGESTEAMMSLSTQYACTIVFGLAEKDEEKFFNTAVIVSKGRYIGKYRKIHLSDFEKKCFHPGKDNRIFDVDGLKIGVQICFDLWFPEISREQIRMGADILCVLANFGGETTYHISKVRAIENLVPLVLCNRIGMESISEMDASFIGLSTVVDASGERISTAPEKCESIQICDVETYRRRANVICSDFDAEMSYHYPS